MNVPESTVPLPAPPAGRLYGRDAECRALDGLVTDVRAGKSRVLVLRGEAGAGKSALLDYLARRAPGQGCQVTRTACARSRAELPFAGLRGLCAPMLGRAGQLPAPQRDALLAASGLAAGPPHRFYAGLALLSLLSGAAGERPLVCLIDDEQWLDRDSAQALGFAARRLAAVPVALVFAARDPGAELAGLPGLELEGLGEQDARALLASALAGPMDPRARDLIVAETRGNPRALLDLPRKLGLAELAGGFGLPGALPPAGRVQDSTARQLAALPGQARRLLQLAAADPSGDWSLVWRAARQLGIPAAAAAPAAEAGLAEFTGPVRFRHPLARSAAYHSAPLPERRRLHAALAAATSAQADPDWRAWHQAQATAGPDEEAAAELERRAGQAQARGGLAAAAAFLERAALLTADPARRAGRTLSAARASLQAGAFGKALELLAEAEAGPPDRLAAASAELLRGQLLLARGPGGDALAPLLKAARHLEPLDASLAREAYLSAWAAAQSAGGPAAGGDLLEACHAARSLPLPARPRAADLVLDALAQTVTDGLAAAVPALRRAVSAFASEDAAAGEALRWGHLGQAAASALWDNGTWRALLARQARLARDAGALAQLPAMLDALGTAVAAGGDFPAALALAAEASAARAVTGGRAAPFTVTMLAALRGAPAGDAVAGTGAGDQGTAAARAWAAAVSRDGLGRYEEALAAARQASEDTTALPFSMWALPELVEAAARTGDTGLARDALKQLTEITQPCGTDSALGIEARCRALLSHDGDAGGLYREAVSRLSRTGLRPDLARARLLYGEWLRREGRRAAAREQLRAARDELAAIGMDAFAERARLELAAAGDKARSAEAAANLTPQEDLIARLARDGRTNPQIGAQLFLSARTVQYHLGKVFAKLGISSRRELLTALA
jgi:DNA-binding CsgD family transcriptional regulator